MREQGGQGRGSVREQGGGGDMGTGGRGKREQGGTEVGGREGARGLKG